LRLRFYHVVLLPLICFALIPIAAQSPVPASSSQTPLIQTSAQAVAVDVLVTNGSGEPVLGLTKQSFEILEDGKPQAIDLFEEHTAPASAPAFTPLQLPPHVYTNLPTAPPSDSVNILLLDSLNTPEADQAFVHRQVADFLKNMQSGTRIAVFTLNTKLHLIQGFTTDSSLLMAALNSKAAAPGTAPASRTREDDLRDKEELSIIGEMVGNSEGLNQEALKSNARSMALHATTQAGDRSSLTLAALQQLARAMAAVPGRKNLFWFATTFPVSIFPNGASRQTLSNGKEIGDAVRLTAGLLTEAKVAVYPVSAQGIIVDHTTNADSAGQPNGDTFETAPKQEAPANSANTGAMEQLASDTGGVALYTSNNLSQAMSHAIQNGTHYYTLVYTPPNSKMDGKFHRIEIKLIEGKARLSYRRGYYADSTSDTKTATASDPCPRQCVRDHPVLLRHFER